MNRDLLKRWNVDGGNCRLLWRDFGGAQRLALYASDGGQPAAAVGRTGGTHRAALWTSVRATRPTLSPDTMHQNREIWSRTTFGKLASVAAAVMCASAIHRRGISSVRGGKADSVCQYDEQGRLIRKTDYGGISTVLLPRRCDWKRYLEETHNAQGALTGRKITETDPQTGSTVTNMDIYEDDGTYLASQYCTPDSHGNIVKQVHVSAGGQMRTCDYQWTYDDAARTATCVDEAEGTTEKILV